MKLLVSTTETQRQRSNDFCYVPEGEICIFTTECDTDRGNPDGSCGCVRSMSGLDCKKGTTTVKVAEVPITRPELRRALRAHYPTLKLSDKVLNQEIAALLHAAAPHPVGTILEKRALAEDAQAFRVRTPRVQ